MNGKANIMRSKLVILVFSIIIGCVFILSLFIEPPTILKSERRVPAKMPVLSTRTVASAEFMDKFENYAADSLPFRESLRTLHSISTFGLFMQTDKNGLYMDSHGVGKFKQIDIKSVEQLQSIIISIANGLDDINVYYSFIPDKSIYSENNLPGYDPALIEHLFIRNPEMAKYKFINLFEALNQTSFYSSDLHWNQVNLIDVLSKLSEEMGFTTDINQYIKEYAGEFQGVYAGQLALPISTDSMYYLSCLSISAMYLNVKEMKMEEAPVYDLDKFTGLDSYDIFLSGAQPLVIIENKTVSTDKELYLFRDSFSSSLAPLLANAYSKVILIDLRYIDLRTLNQLIEFNSGSDALFLYSSLVLNNADMLFVNTP